MAAATAAFLSSAGAAVSLSVVEEAAFLALARAMAAATAAFLSSAGAALSPSVVDAAAFCSLYLRACSLRAARSKATSLLSGSKSAP